MFYPAGWKVFIDGMEEPIYKTDYAFRSVFLQPGVHKIEFLFRPKMFKTGLSISLVSFLLLVLGAVLGWRIEKKKKPNV
jgi:uncharacterized membrane protein YfhO